MIAWIPDVQHQGAGVPVMYVAQASSQASSSHANAYALGVCRVVSSESDDVYPVGDAENYFRRFFSKDVDSTSVGGWSADARVSVRVISQPKYGRLLRKHLEDGDLPENVFEYVAGTDSAVDDGFVVEVRRGDVSVEIHYELSVDVGQPDFVFDEHGDKVADPGRCEKEAWKI